MFFNIRNPFSKKRNKNIETKSTTKEIPIRQGSFLDFALRGFGVVTASQAMQFYKDNSAVATSVDMIADAFEEITPVLKTDDGSFVDASEIISFIKNPNGLETWKEFSGQAARHYLLTHNSYLSALGFISSPPLEMYSVKPQNVSTIEDVRDSYPGSCLISSGVGKGSYQRENPVNGVSRFFDGNLRELYHIMGFSSLNNNVQGDSPLNAALLEVRQQIESKTHNLNIIERGGRLSLIVSFNDDVGVDEHKDRKKRIREDLGGHDNAGGIAVVSGADMDVKEASLSAKDMDFATLDAVSAQAIYLRYRIPLPLVTLSASTFNNFETSIPLLYDQAVLPLANTIFNALSKFLLPRYGLDPKKFKISFDPDSITALMTRRLEEIERRAKLNIETTNELRSLLPNRENIDGGHVVYQPINLVPIGTEIEENEGEL